MLRAELEELRPLDLHYFTRTKAITTPGGVSHKNLVDIILEHQAKVLVERAKRALREVRGVVDGINVTNFMVVDGHRQEPQSGVSSVYKPSESSHTGQTSVDGASKAGGVGGYGASQAVSDRVEEREELNPQTKRMKEVGDNE